LLIFNANYLKTRFCPVREKIFIEKIIQCLISPVRDGMLRTMANTDTQLYIQFVFAVQNRASLIQPAWKNELYKHITGIVQNNGHKLLAINGMPNHTHIFIGYRPHQLIPELLQEIKGSSSKWINKKQFMKGKFNRQQGYGAFSYSHSHIDRAIKYILHQQQHHTKKSFQEEYQELLDKFKIEYDRRYLLKDIQ